MNVIELTRIESGLGVRLPDNLLQLLQVSEGERLLVTASPNGIVLSRYEPAVAEQVDAGRGFMAQYRLTFEELAK